MIFSLRFANGTHAMTGHPAEAKVMTMPSDVLVPGDTVEVQLRTYEDGGRNRGLVQQYQGVTEFELLPLLPMSVVSDLGEARVPFASLPDIDDVTTSLALQDQDLRREVATTSGWRIAMQATDLTFELPDDLGQFDAVSGLVERSLRMEAPTKDGGVRWTSIMQRVPGAEGKSPSLVSDWRPYSAQEWG